MAKRLAVHLKLRTYLEAPGRSAYNKVSSAADCMEHTAWGVSHEVEFVLKGIFAQKGKLRFNTGVVNCVKDIIRATERKA